MCTGKFHMCDTALVNYKLRVWLLILLLAAVCGVAIWGVARFRNRSLETVEAWMARTPARDAVLVYLDLGALRQTGALEWLANTSATEPEYQAFVRSTGFDYTNDLDAVLASFGPAGKYFIVKGRFDWRLLENYATTQGGQCQYAFCTLDGSTPDRKISFFPLTRGLMGLAVSPDTRAAHDLSTKAPGAVRFEPPVAPVWAYVPGSLLRQNAQLPESTRVLASVLEKSNSLLFTLVAKNDGFEAGLQVRCTSERDAAALETQLQRVTILLGQASQRENRVAEAQVLSNVLSAGVFRHQGPRLTGSWPIPRAFLEALLGG
jgi:hypothetical protein